MRAAWVLLVVVLFGCPERAVPPRGVELVFEKSQPRSVQSTVDRRFAAARFKAQVRDEETRLVIRLQDGDARPEEVKALLQVPGHFAWCPASVDGGVARDCLEAVHVVAAQWMDEAPGFLTLELDRSSAAAFAAFTAAHVGQSVEVMLDGRALASVLISAAIPEARRVVVPVTREAQPWLLPVLQGGPLPTMTLSKESTFGPPRL